MTHPILGAAACAALDTGDTDALLTWIFASQPGEERARMLLHYGYTRQWGPPREHPNPLNGHDVPEYAARFEFFYATVFDRCEHCLWTELVDRWGEIGDRIEPPRHRPTCPNR